jgi:metal-sulfur cluster biosynthetic enzyme
MKIANLSLDEIKEKLGRVKHPAIDDTLLELGILQKVEIKEEKVKIILAFPFPNIPIKDELIRLVEKPLKDLKIKVAMETTTMDEKTLKKFLVREQQNWRG